MNQKNLKFSNNSLWWLDFSVINTANTAFTYKKNSNTYVISINSTNLFFLINSKNLSSVYFYILDGCICKNTLFISYQSFFFDFKVLINIKFKDVLKSITNSNYGFSWVERELREFNNVSFFGLNDTRKLLSNYTYENTLSYNNYNNIINDLNL